jgi:hypothetical protein
VHTICNSGLVLNLIVLVLFWKFYTLNFVLDIIMKLQEISIRNYLSVSKTISGIITQFNRLLFYEANGDTFERYYQWLTYSYFRVKDRTFKITDCRCRETVYHKSVWWLIWYIALCFVDSEAHQTGRCGAAPCRDVALSLGLSANPSIWTKWQCDIATTLRTTTRHLAYIVSDRTTRQKSDNAPFGAFSCCR